jgi:hypothetical protein
MSIRTTISAALGTKPRAPATAAEIKARLAAQDAAVRDLERRHAQVSLAWAVGEDGAAGALQTIDGELEAARREGRALQAALALAQDKAVQEEAARIAALQATQIRAVEQHLGQRDKAAAELAVAIENAVSAYRRLLDRSAKARSACPVGAKWPGGLCDVGALKETIGHEMWRVGAGPAGPNGIGFPSAFPGAHPPRIGAEPGTIEPMAEVVQRASRHVLDTLKGTKPVEQKPAPLVAAPLLTAPAAPAASVATEEQPSGPRIDATAYVPPKVRLS